MVDVTPRKCCGKCGRTKSVDQFSRDRSNKDGLAAWCKACWKEFRATVDYDVDPTVREKRCSKCKFIKPVNQFGAYRKSKDGLGPWCKPCAREHNRERARRLNYDVDSTLIEKRCGKCKEIKPVDQFDRHRGRKDGFQTRCRVCMKEINRDWYVRNKSRAAANVKAWAQKYPERAKLAGRKGHLKKTYGLTVEDYDRMLEAQGGKCVCGAVEDPLHVDHDHKTGEVRGLLCGSCNRTIGMALDSPKRLRVLALYLHRSQVGVSL